MHVSFIFDRMDYIGVELRDAEWKEGYRYVTFGGSWFTTKYNIHTAWKIVCYNGKEYVTCPNCGGGGTVQVAETFDLSGGGF